MVPFTLLGLDRVNHSLKDKHVFMCFPDLDYEWHFYLSNTYISTSLFPMSLYSTGIRDRVMADLTGALTLHFMTSVNFLNHRL